MADKPPHQRHETELLEKVGQRSLERLRQGQQDVRTDYLTWSLENQSAPVQKLDRVAFRLPLDASKYLGGEPACTLQELLYEVWELNERFVGEPALEAYVQINGSPEQLDIIGRSLQWARAYVARRLRRPSTRDRGCPYRKFLRLYNELLPFIDTLGVRYDSEEDRKAVGVTGQYLGQMCDYIAWSLFDGTWASEVKWVEGGAMMPKPKDVDPITRAQCFGTFKIYHWVIARVFDRLVERMARAIADSADALPAPDAEHRRIEQLAEDIREMKPFLVRNYPLGKAIVELPGGLFAQFMWDTHARLMSLSCAESERELLELQQRSVGKMQVVINASGLLCCAVNPWRTVDNYEHRLPVPAITVGRLVLEAVHARLFSFYEKIDVDAILARWRAASDSPVSTEEQTEAIAAAIATGAAAAQGDQPDVQQASQRGRVTSSLRLSQLRAVLERQFDCTLRSGKGSELLLYREGGQLAYVARHKANPQLSAVEIQRILRKLGIGVGEWLAATCTTRS